MELNLRHYLLNWLNERGSNALEELAEYDIRVGRDERHPNLFNLKYGSILADKSNPLVCACRGAVVERDSTGCYNLVAYAFDRFFNVGEGHCHELDWSCAKVYEKYDGSLIKLLNYGGEWIVSTSGTVAAAAEVGTTGRSFAELFWLVFDEVGYSREVLDPDLCYIFELCHRDNRIVVDYAESQLPLLAIRDRTQDFEEMDLVQFCESSGFSAAMSYDFGDLAAVESAVNGRGADHEGFILFDGRGRVKVKSDVYCQLHKVRGNGEPDFSELFLNDDLEEFLLHFPEYRDQFQFHLAKIETMEILVLTMVSSYSHLDQKNFAQAVLKESKELSGACFALRAGKYGNFGQWVENLRPQQLDNLLGI